MDKEDIAYVKFIENKRVAFVAPSLIGIGKRRGAEIDSHDVVVRTNHYYDLISCGLYVEDYGRKIDVLYVNVQYAREMCPFPVGQLRKLGVKWICYKARHEDMKTYNAYFDIRKVSDAAIGECRAICPSATAGNFILSDIGKLNPLSFDIYGMDFFSGQSMNFDGTFDYYLPGYLPKWIQAQAIAIVGEKIGHDFYGNAMLTRYLVNKYCINLTKEARKILDSITTDDEND